MPTSKEKSAFAKRLQDQIARKNIKGGTQLARQFNLLHRGEAPVSPQTAHKWLTGRTIPTPDKLQTLADWLGVGVHWLHYGPPPPVGAKSKPLAPGEKYPLTPEAIELASKIEALDPKDRHFLEEFVERLYDTGKE
ncbi:XRE family transcriptional regulator [Paraburkholderia sp.]|jgi:transcriptional regulator with XRE-family HTH domain|uniref:XRE family transcriptional regulator n=1 Tax=unclassified Paraburkholderia TaxID=2615204 RepID=UPI000EFD31CF|nr:XRE family transcriptional regulator [Paraburkholderia sp.]